MGAGDGRGADSKNLESESGRLFDGKSGSLPTDDQIQADLNIPRLSIPEREKMQTQAFQDRGAKAGEPLILKEGEVPPLDVYDRVIVQEAGDPERHNLYVVKKGKSDRYVIVGGHLDKVEAGFGIIDNLTGSRMVLHLFQAMREIETDANIIFINFTREEEGLLGSDFWLHSFPKEIWKKFDAMFNVDTMGIDATAVMKNGSTKKLEEMIVRLARQLGIPIIEGVITGGDSDHTTFRRAGIPSVMEYGASSEDKIFDIIHTENDNYSNFSLKNYKDNLLLALSLLQNISQTPVREPLETIAPEKAENWNPAETMAMNTLYYARLFIEGTDYTGLKGTLPMIAKSIAQLSDGKFKNRLIRARDAIQDILWANLRAQGYQFVMQARKFSAEGRHAEAARMYKKAAKLYRHSSPVGSQEAKNLMKLAAAESSR